MLCLQDLIAFHDVDIGNLGIRLRDREDVQGQVGDLADGVGRDPDLAVLQLLDEARIPEQVAVVVVGQVPRRQRREGIHLGVRVNQMLVRQQALGKTGHEVGRAQQSNVDAWWHELAQSDVRRIISVSGAAFTEPVRVLASEYASELDRLSDERRDVLGCQHQLLSFIDNGPLDHVLRILRLDDERNRHIGST